jgi:uncharacterized protein YbjT (DUF2867 family)
MPTVLVTGASGFVGSHVVPELVRGGFQVRALVRDAGAADLVLKRLTPAQRDSVETRRGDILDQASLVAAMSGTTAGTGTGAGSRGGAVDAVVHLVAIPRDSNGGRDLQRINVDGTRNVIEAMRTAGVRRIVHLGGLGTVESPRLRFATSKARAERLVAESGLDWTTLKPSVLWGLGDGFFNQLARTVQLFPIFAAMPGTGSARFHPFAAADLARCVRLSLERPETSGRAIELGGPEILPYRELVGEVMRGMGQRRIIVPMPVPLIALAAGISGVVRIPFPVSVDQLRQLALDNTTSLDACQRAFGFEPRSIRGRLGYLRSGRRAQERALGRVEEVRDEQAAGEDAQVAKDEQAVGDDA